MEALAAQGDPAAALQVYEGLRRLLRDELGTAPGDEAQALHRRLLGAPTLRKRPVGHDVGNHAREGIMAKPIRCECGATARADTDDELVAVVERHVTEHHPDLVGKLSREDILAMAETE